MCEPATIALVGTAVVGAGIKIASDRRAATFNAAVASNNAELARAQSVDARRRGIEAAARIESDAARTKSAATVVMAKSGIETDAPFGASDAAASLAAEQAKANAAREAHGFMVQQQDFGAQAKQIKRSSILGSVGTGLSAAGSIIGKV